MKRILIAVVATLALIAPLAFTTLADTAENRVRDAKMQALQRGELVGWDAHELLDAAKAERVRLAMDRAADAEVPAGPVPCVEGFAGPYQCQNIDLAAVVPLAELGGVAGNDSWGWTDPENGNEIAIIGTGTGVAFVDVTEPTSPVVLAHLPSEGGDGGTGVEVVPEAAAPGNLWRDLKVDGNYAFIASEVANSGMQVFDLTRLREFYGTHNPANRVDADHVNNSFSSTHNIAVNTESDTAYIVGSTECAGGLHMIDISDPLNTAVAGCYDADGYTHDVQCVIYHGPDEDHQGDEICFASNEDTVTIVDVTDKSNPVQLGRVGYTTAAYTHQGWLTPDHRTFVFNDEVDEQAGTVDNTTTYVLALDDLDLGNRPLGDLKDGLVRSYTHDSTSTDHNLYVTDANANAARPLIWEANYNAGLQVFQYADDAALRAGELERVAYFRVDSAVDFPHYGDAWNVYPFFESGTVTLSNLGQGLVVLTPDYEAINGAG